MENFKNAEKAFEYYYNLIDQHGVGFDGTKAMFNVGFYINDQTDNHIDTWYRDWNLKYAEAEWEWYLSGDDSVDKLGELYGKVPAIWERMALGPQN